MAKELLIGALRGERVEQTPWLPHIGTHPAQLLGVSAERYLQDAELLARGAVLCAEHYRCDGIPLVDDPQLEAISLGCLFLTGGEPFILHDIFNMLLYGLERMHVTVLSNGILLKGKRLQQLETLPHRDRLTIQISLDGSNAATHDLYRGAGSWQKAVDAIVRLKEAAFHVRLGTTQTPENRHDLATMCQLHRSLGIPDEDHIIRPLVRRGFSARGMAISLPALEPEVTVNREGVFWHPVATDPDLLISSSIFPVRDSVERIKEIRESMFMVTAGAATRYR
jgi:pyruvate-formate lyase-activating enzyme